MVRETNSKGPRLCAKIEIEIISLFFSKKNENSMAVLIARNYSKVNLWQVKLVEHVILE